VIKSGIANFLAIQRGKYESVINTLIEMGVDVVYPVELPALSSLNLDGRNSFEPIVCKLLPRTVYEWDGTANYILRS
jgi:hypothetical protein